MPATTRGNGYKVDVSRGDRVGRVPSEWFSRRRDERFPRSPIWAAPCANAPSGAGPARWKALIIRSESLRPRTPLLDPTRRGGPDRRRRTGASGSSPAWSAPGRLSAPASAALAGINLQYGRPRIGPSGSRSFEIEEGRVELRAVTGPDYGRIHDYELSEAIQRIAGNGTGDTRWKVPGVLDWSTGIYNPRVDVSKDTTTLYASDRDVFVFLVDDLNPIEAGRLPDGSPDLFFRGFYAWNSEVGAKTLGIASFYLRAVCQIACCGASRISITIRHSKYGRPLRP
jgi:hypothetical protein